MSEKNTKRLHILCGTVTGVFVLITGVCLIVSCLSICRSGQRPFSPESVAAHFNAIRIPVFACVISAVVSGILHHVFPAQTGRTKAIREEADILASLKQRTGTLTDTNAVREDERIGHRLQLTALLLMLLQAGLICRLVLLFLDGSFFTVESLDRDLLRLLLTICLYALLLLGIQALRFTLESRLLRRRIALYKAALAEGKTNGIPSVRKETRDRKRGILILRCTVAAAAFIFILLGIFNGGVQDVLGKAIAICTECIGLG